jgi:hypothetical protein
VSPIGGGRDGRRGTVVNASAVTSYFAPTWRTGRRGAPRRRRRRISDAGTHFCSANIRFRPLRKDRAGMLLVRAPFRDPGVRTVIEGDT